MKFTCEIDMDNAAFEDGPATELASILRTVIACIEAGGENKDGKPLRDINGNTVGRFDVMGD